MKKLIALVLALAMVATCVVAFAASGLNGNTGKVTIDNAIVGKTYTIYEVLKLESYDTEKSAYMYKAASDSWSTFLNQDTIKGVYVTIDSDGFVKWVEGADAAGFAKLAKAYATTNNIGNQGQETATSTTVEFENLNLGYYLVDSSVGILCSLNTTATCCYQGKERCSRP